MCGWEGFQRGMGFRVFGDLRQGSCMLSTAINGDNHGPRVSDSQGAWQVGRASLGKPYVGILAAGIGQRVCRGRCLMVRLGRAVQGHGAGRGVLLSAPRAGRDKGRALKAASVRCELQLTPD